MKCKNILGIKICKLSSSEVIQLPANVSTKVPITIYTSKNCTLCKSLISNQLKQFKSIKDIINPRIVNVDSEENIPSEILSLPNIQVGSQILGVQPTDKEIVRSIQKYYSFKE